MNELDEISKELKEINPVLAGINRINVFTVPLGYFDHLAEKITNFTLLNQEEPILKKGEEVLQVPQGYFDSISDSILSKIKRMEKETEGNEFQQSFPLLHSLKGKNVFSVPKNYFENLSTAITEKINKTPEDAKIISIGKKWWKYAAAAVITGAIAISSLQLFNGGNEAETYSYAYEIANQFKTPDQFEKGIASLSDDEIINYLETRGSILDNEALINGVDASELPSAFDYLLDENTLKNYLDKINAGNSN